MEREDLEKEYTAEEKRELAKSYRFKENATDEERERGLDLMWEAHLDDDPEALFWIAWWLMNGYVKLQDDNDPVEYALYCMRRSAVKGDLHARRDLEEYCRMRYEELMKDQPKIEGPLVDFLGKRIRISRKGLRAPVDVTLDYKNGQNILTIRADVKFLYSDELPNKHLFESAVCMGFREWEGDYTVFGGQKLRVRVDVIKRKRRWDVLLVLPVTPSRWQLWL